MCGAICPKRVDPLARLPVHPLKIMSCFNGPTGPRANGLTENDHDPLQPTLLRHCRPDRGLHRSRHHPAQSGACRDLPDLRVFRQRVSVLSLRGAVSGGAHGDCVRRSHHDPVSVHHHDAESGVARGAAVSAVADRSGHFFRGCLRRDRCVPAGPGPVRRDSADRSPDRTGRIRPLRFYEELAGRRNHLAPASGGDDRSALGRQTAGKGGTGIPPCLSPSDMCSPWPAS